MNIIVAEDELQNKMLIERVLTKLGHVSVIVDNGIDVLKKLEAENFDVLILDLSLPLMDGIETSNQIRTGGRVLNPNIPIVILSGSSPDYLRDVCNKYKMNTYLTKPFRFGELKNVLEQIAN